MKKNLLILVMFLISSGLMAQTTVWNPAAFDNSQGLWINPGNWTNGLPGDVAMKTVFNVDGAMDCIVDEDVTADDLGLTSLPKIVQGDNGPGGVLHIQDGGALTTADEWSGIGWNHPAKLIVDEGGEITFGQHMWIAFEPGSSGTEVHLNGGTINVNGMFGMDWLGNDNECTLFLNSGLLSLSNIHNEGQSMGENAMIEYTGGLMQIRGDHKDVLETLYVDKITGDYQIWVEPVINGTDTTYITKLSNEGAPAIFNVTFNVDMSSADDFDPAVDVVYITGSFWGDWIEPGESAENQTMTRVDNSMIYTVTMELEAGTYEYKYFLNAGWDGGEWDGGDNREVVVTADKDVDDIWGDDGTGTFVNDFDPLSVNIYPNPASSKLYISHTVKIDRVEIYNITGSRVLSQDNVTTEAIDISELNSGLYFISVIDVNNNNIVRKIIKQ